MARLKTTIPPSGHNILIVDDDTTLVATLEQLLTQEGHQIYTANNGPEALQLCAQCEIHLILLDYFMPGMTGEDVIRELRLSNNQTQVMLQTGYSSDKPPRQMLRELDIQAYHDKSEGPEKLLVLIDGALKTYRHERALRISRDGLQYILEATPQLHRLQPLEDLMQGVLLQIQGLLGFSGAFVATISSSTKLEPDALGGLVATTQNDNIEIRVATGRFSNKTWHDIETLERDLVWQSLQSGKVKIDSVLALPLTFGSQVIGVVLVDCQLAPSADVALLEIFASQAAVAIENTKLYELATIDDLTRLAVRRHWSYLTENILHLSCRHAQPVSFLMLDIDHFKRLNDNYGHMAGDAVLKALGQLLTMQLRKSDLIGRYGGEEIIITLPHTDHQAALITAEKIRTAIESLSLGWQASQIRFSSSIGVCSLELTDWEHWSKLTVTHLRDLLIARADQALYAAKQAGRNRVVGKVIELAQLELV